MNKSISESIVKTLVLSVILIFILILVPMGIGLGKSGFSFAEGDATTFNFVLFQFLFYGGPGIGFLVGILLFFTIEIIITKGDFSYGSGISFNNPGELPSPRLKYFKGYSGMLKLFLLSLIIFSILGLYSVRTGQSFMNVATLEKQQFTVFDNLLYSSSLIPSSENLGAAFFWALGLLIIRSLSRKFKLDRSSFMFISIFACVLIFLTYGYILHQLRYVGNEVALTTVLLFWAFSGLITVLSGSFIPAFVLHINNNLFLDLQAYYTSDIIFNYTIGIILLLIVLYVALFVRGRKHR